MRSIYEYYKRIIYCTVLGVFNPTMTPNVQCWRYLTTLLHVYVTCHSWTPICNVLGYWRHHSICYTSLFTTSLVVITISVYSVLWPSDVVSRSGPLISFLLSVLWSLFSVFISVSLLSLSVVFSLLCVLSPAPQIQCLRLEQKTPSLTVAFSVASVSQQFGCLGNSKSVPDRWVATFISEVPPNPSQYCTVRFKSIYGKFNCEQ
jgi:hypothetical protein